MTLIDDIIRREVNPFDLINLKASNFWEEKQGSTVTVNSIHQEAIAEIEGLLELVAKDHRSRTVLLAGDSGSGKSYLLGRLKRTLNPKAFFVYILCNWADSGHIWRHILRYTVDSLIQIPEGQQESQLILWLKSLSAFTKRNLKQRIVNDSIWQLLQSDRQKFITHLKDTYKQARIYNPDIFFGVLHGLTDPELYPSACEWLRGDNLSEESMQALKVRQCIDTEDAAKNILANFGKIATETQPIVLCFDNLDSMPQLPDGFLDIQPFFNVNTTIHGECLKNFLAIISVVTNTWKRHGDRILQADKAGIHRLIQLKRISLEQVEALWVYHLKSLHEEADPKPNSPIFPLTRNLLEQKFPGGKTIPRNAILLGRQEYQRYKDSIKLTIKSVKIQETEINDKKLTTKQIQIEDEETKITQEEIDDKIAELKLIWQDEYNNVQAKISKISFVAATDLIKMLQTTMEALQVQEIRPKLLNGRHASDSLSYQHSKTRKRVGIVWTEDSNMNVFFNVMNVCQRAIQQNLCQTMYLIRIGSVGNPTLAGNKLYRQIFTLTNHRHLKPTLSSVHYLATYESLVNSALGYDLVVKGKTISVQELEDLIRKSNILHRCTLLQDLGIVIIPDNYKVNDNEKHDLQVVKEFLFSLVKVQGYMGVSTLIAQTEKKFLALEQLNIHQLIQQLCQEQKVQIINPKAKVQDQLICLVTS
ncbi:hypothetical protein NUACC21_59180 [Scytonema sp. NUACC21]